MTEPRPKLTDETALKRNRERATALRSDLFLQTAARDEVQDRLSIVNKAFNDVAVVTPFSAIWADIFPNLWVTQDDDTLDLHEARYDLVIHSMSLHWANDPVGQLIQCRRALKPDGLFLCVCLGGETLTELRTALTEAEVQTTGGLSPRIAPMGEVRQLGALLQRAGFTLPVADQIHLNTSYASPKHLMHDLRSMGEGNALQARRRTFTRKGLINLAETTYVEKYGTSDGRVPATFEFVVLTGWAPDPSQPQALRPGSATKRLADALGVEEGPLQD